MPIDEPLKGKMVAFTNDQHAPDKPHVPAFRGKISMPWEDMEHVVTLWLKPMPGGTFISGNIAALPYEQMAAMSGAPAEPCPPMKVGTENAPVVIDHRGIILFPNKKTNLKQPDYYGWAHSGQPTRPAVRIALWAHNDENGRVYLIGSTQEHLDSPAKAPDVSPSHRERTEHVAATNKIKDPRQFQDRLLKSPARNPAKHAQEDDDEPTPRI